jgi:hypothetical protein
MALRLRFNTNHFSLSSQDKIASIIGNVQREQVLSTSFKCTSVRSLGLRADNRRELSCSFTYKAGMGKDR